MTTGNVSPARPPLVDVEQLVRAARRGEPAAMDALVRALIPYVGRVCGAIALDRGDDAMQETFIAVLRNIRSLREPAALHGWVRRIAVREAIRAARGGREDPVDPDALVDAGAVTRSTSPPSSTSGRLWPASPLNSAPSSSCATSTD